ncbi:hypothetical protein KSD_03670 [Ktedonobacter sp. SOSP1-85]|nr:hypothetical protein KSD_03670 [Ktedonobacter sp. SOSP1-85]
MNLTVADLCFVERSFWALFVRLPMLFSLITKMSGESRMSPDLTPIKHKADLINPLGETI